MEPEEKGTQKEQSIRVLFPKLYKHIASELEEIHIHPYDIQANIQDVGPSYRVILHYGDGFAHTESQLFTADAINQLSTELTTFIKETGEMIKQVMIADYFKMMKI
jgi:hypothetical protein